MFSNTQVFVFVWLLTLSSMNHGSSIGAQLRTLAPGDGVVEFKRVLFKKGDAETDWGVIFIEQKSSVIPRDSLVIPDAGFINVFGHVIMPGKDAAKYKDKENAGTGWNANIGNWMVRNVRRITDRCEDLPPIVFDRLEKMRNSSSKPEKWVDPCDDETKEDPQDKTSFFHLGKVVDSSASLSAVVVFTEKPLYKGKGSIQINQRGGLKPEIFSLRDSITMSDFEYTDDDVSEVRTAPPEKPRFEEKMSARGPGEYTWYKQIAKPNIETAVMQCVPMAFANILQFLEDSFPSYLTLDHDHGSGFCNVPPTYIVAVLDFEMGRTENKGVGYEQAMEGFLNYVVRYSSGIINLIHQGTSAKVYSSSDGAIKSHSVGRYPTFEFICTEIQRGHGVFLWYGRYSVGPPNRRLSPPGAAGGAPRAGDRHGGHAVRVVGCAAIGNENRLLVVHDRYQGPANNGGTVEWEWNDVDDYTGDQYLNFEGFATRKVELVVSMVLSSKGCDNDEQPPKSD